jgi:hypothetical protein
MQVMKWVSTCITYPLGQGKQWPTSLVQAIAFSLILCMPSVAHQITASSQQASSRASMQPDPLDGQDMWCEGTMHRAARACLFKDLYYDSETRTFLFYGGVRGTAEDSKKGPTATQRRFQLQMWVPRLSHCQLAIVNSTRVLN